jgi:hypothetical protein
MNHGGVLSTFEYCSPSVFIWILLSVCFHLNSAVRLSSFGFCCPSVFIWILLSVCLHLDSAVRLSSFEFCCPSVFIWILLSVCLHLDSAVRLSSFRCKNPCTAHCTVLPSTEWGVEILFLQSIIQKPLHRKTHFYMNLNIMPSSQIHPTVNDFFLFKCSAKWACLAKITLK